MVQNENNKKTRGIDVGLGKNVIYFACIDVLLIGQWGSFLEPILKDFVQNYKEFNF